MKKKKRETGAKGLKRGGVRGSVLPKKKTRVYPSKKRGKTPIHPETSHCRPPRRHQVT